MENMIFMCYNQSNYKFLIEGESFMTINSVEEFNSKIKRTLITEEEIKEATKRIGKEISDSYDGRPILLVSILKGAFVFMADLCRAVSIPC